MRRTVFKLRKSEAMEEQEGKMKKCVRLVMMQWIKNEELSLFRCFTSQSKKISVMSSSSSSSSFPLCC